MTLTLHGIIILILLWFSSSYTTQQQLHNDCKEKKKEAIIIIFYQKSFFYFLFSNDILNHELINVNLNPERVASESRNDVSSQLLYLSPTPSQSMVNFMTLPGTFSTPPSTSFEIGISGQLSLNDASCCHK